MSNIKSKSITRNTTCSNLFNSNELEYCCEICRKKVDILTISRKPRKYSNKDKHRVNKCKQPQTASYASSASRALHYAKICEYLNIDFDEVYSRTNTSYKPIKWYHRPETNAYKWYSDYKSASSVERVEAFLKLGRPDPVEYANAEGPVTWEHVVTEVSKVLAAHE